MQSKFSVTDINKGGRGDFKNAGLFVRHRVQWFWDSVLPDLGGRGAVGLRTPNNVRPNPSNYFILFACIMSHSLLH